MLSYGDSRPVVVDNGSDTCKAGLAGNDAPSAVFPCVVGYPRTKTIEDERFVGHDATSKSGILSLHHPVEYGVITNWDDMELVWNHVLLEELRLCTEEHPVLLTEPPCNPKVNRERSTQIMFETFKTPALYLACQSVLSLLAAARTTGISVDVGKQQTTAVPVYEGYALSHAVSHSCVSGVDLTHYLMQFLADSGHAQSRSYDRMVARDMKEKLCYVASHFEQDMAVAVSNPSSIEKNYELPDGIVISVGKARFCCPEILFRPSLISVDAAASVHEMVSRSIQSCEDIQGDLYANISLSGGSSMFPGFADRMHKEISSLAPASTNVHVLDSPSHRHAAWLGGSLFASQATFDQMCMSRQEYEEHGPAFVHRKCF